nr:hypothetical protein GCM10020063_037250 [Dactylosporangium thailandense]
MNLTVLASAVYLPGDDPGAPPPERAHEVLGRKGLLGKDAATRLAICAAHRTLERPDRAPRPAGPADPRTAVVVSSNLGNVAAVRGVVRTVRESGGRGVSPLLAPVLSSNVIAGALAIWFRWSGPNLMICSGATGGLDAVASAALLLRSGRAERVVVVGCEPADPDAAAVYGRPLRAAAACLILARSGPAGSPHIGAVRPVPDGGAAGDSYGADGVLRVADAAAAVRAGSSTGRFVVCGDAADGWRGVRVSAS